MLGAIDFSALSMTSLQSPLAESCGAEHKNDTHTHSHAMAQNKGANLRHNSQQALMHVIPDMCACLATSNLITLRTPSPGTVVVFDILHSPRSGYARSGGNLLDDDRLGLGRLELDLGLGLGLGLGVGSMDTETEKGGGGGQSENSRC